MELTIKELAPYLPYGLKCRIEVFGDNETIVGLESLNYNEVELSWQSAMFSLTNNEIEQTITNYFKYNDIKPILYPLDYFEYDHIIQVKEHLGLGQWCDYYDQYFDAWFDDAENVDKLVLQAPYEIFQFFLEIKLDVFSLIKKGLAIAVTEDFNPYK